MCMTFGAICAATDPVAVVALLKSLGASTGLTMIITGESLLNDGTAMVLFNIFFAKVAAEPDAPETAAEILRVFFRMALGGPALGFALGLVALGALWLTSAPRAAAYASGDPGATWQFAITLGCAYLSFFVGRFYTHILHRARASSSLGRDEEEVFSRPFGQCGFGFCST